LRAVASRFGRRDAIGDQTEGGMHRLMLEAEDERFTRKVVKAGR